MNFRWLVASLAAMLVLLTFAACGDDDSSSSTSASPSSGTSATATSGPDDSETASRSATPKRTSTPKKTATPRATGGSDTDTSTPENVDETTPEINECDLVTLNDLSTVIGESFTAAGVLSGDSCSWDGANGTNAEITTYDLSAYGAGNEKEFFETFATVFGVDVLDSPGDEAYYGDTVGLSILDGKYELDVVLTASDGSSDRVASFALGEKALANMP